MTVAKSSVRGRRTIAAGSCFHEENGASAAANAIRRGRGADHGRLTEELPRTADMDAFDPFFADCATSGGSGDPYHGRI